MRNIIVRASLPLIVISAMARCLAGPINLPASQWGAGTVNGLLNVAYNQGTLPTGTPTCSGLVGTCNISEAGTGSSAGLATSSTDANGIHVYASVSSAGQESSYMEAFTGFTDILTNNGNVTANIQIGFSVDGSLSDNGGAYSYLYVDVWHGYALPTVQDHVTGTQNYLFSLTGSNPNVTLPISQNYLTNIITLAPGASYQYSISMDAEAITSQGAGTAIDNASSITDASNTLSLTSFTATDSEGNALPISSIGSSSGFNYNGVQTSSSPEPGTLVLLAVPLLTVARQVHRRRRTPATL